MPTGHIFAPGDEPIRSVRVWNNGLLIQCTTHLVYWRRGLGTRVEICEHRGIYPGANGVVLSDCIGLRRAGVHLTTLVFEGNEDYSDELQDERELVEPYETTEGGKRKRMPDAYVAPSTRTAEKKFHFVTTDSQEFTPRPVGQWEDKILYNNTRNGTICELAYEKSEYVHGPYVMDGLMEETNTNGFRVYDTWYTIWGGKPEEIDESEICLPKVFDFDDCIKAV